MQILENMLKVAKLLLITYVSNFINEPLNNMSLFRLGSVKVISDPIGLESCKDIALKGLKIRSRNHF